MENNKCCAGDIITNIYIIKKTDVKITDGKVVMKRKYGKFERKIIRLK